MARIEEKAKRNVEIYYLRRKKYTLQEIAKLYGICPERVRQIDNKMKKTLLVMRCH